MSIRAVLERASVRWDIPVDQLLTHSRGGRFPWCRKLTMWMCRQLTDCSLTQIGKVFGCSSVAVHKACREVDNWRAEHPRTREVLDALMREVNVSK